MFKDSVCYNVSQKHILLAKEITAWVLENKYPVVVQFCETGVHTIWICREFKNDKPEGWAASYGILSWEDIDVLKLWIIEWFKVNHSYQEWFEKQLTEKKVKELAIKDKNKMEPAPVFLILVIIGLIILTILNKGTQ